MAKNNVIKLLLKNNKVNNYTKMMIILSNLNYFEDYYIPNKKLMRMLGINKNRVIVLLHQLQDDKVIKIFYKGRKRYFIFLAKCEEKNESILEEVEAFDNYNWLEDGEW